MKSQTSLLESRIRRDSVTGSRSFNNYLLASVLTLGSLGFLGTGISSFLQTHLLPIFNTENISFLPQGLVMTFYGLLGLTIGVYLWLTILWQIGDGFNEFNKDKGMLYLFRWGFPGSNRKVNVQFPLEDIESILIQSRSNFQNQRNLYIRLKGRGEIPLLNMSNLIQQDKMEIWAAELAQFLNVPLEA